MIFLLNGTYGLWLFMLEVIVMYWSCARFVFWLIFYSWSGFVGFVAAIQFFAIICFLIWQCLIYHGCCSYNYFLFSLWIIALFSWNKMKCLVPARVCSMLVMMHAMYTCMHGALHLHMCMRSCMYVHGAVGGRVGCRILCFHWVVFYLLIHLF